MLIHCWTDNGGDDDDDDNDTMIVKWPGIDQAINYVLN